VIVNTSPIRPVEPTLTPSKSAERFGFVGETSTTISSSSFRYA